MAAQAGIANITERAASKHHTCCKLCGFPELKLVNVEHQLVECPACGFVFGARTYSSEELAGLYQALYHAGGGYGDYYSGTLKQLQAGGTPWIGFERRAVLRRVLRQGARRIGELGASMGMTARYLDPFDVEYHGVEFDPATAALARDLGFNIKPGDHSALKTLPGPLDALVTFEVLEHVPDIKECLLDIRNCLKPGGLLGLTVPNYDRRLNYLSTGALGQTEPPIHLNFWTVRSLKATLEQFGFQVEFIKARRRPNPDPKRPLATLGAYLKMVLRSYHGPQIMCVARKS